MKLRLNSIWKTVKINNKDKQIPIDWEISNISNRINEFPSSKLPASHGCKAGKYKFFNASEKQTLFCNEPQIKEEAVIITTGGDYAFSLYSEGNFSFSSHVWCFKMIKDSNLFFNYLFKYYFQDIQNLSVYGFKLKNLNKKSFKKIQFHFPPIEQQKSIANVLSTQESLINEMEELIELYEKRLRYTSNELLSGRLRIKEVDGETVFYKNTKWKTVKVNGKDVEIPEDWEVKKNSELCEIVFGKRIVKSKSKGEIPVYGSGGASFSTNEYNQEKAWVIGRFAVTSKCVRFVNEKFWLLDSGFTFKTKNVFLGHKFFSKQNFIYKKFARGGGQKNIEMDDFRKMEIETPPILEQEKIVEIFNQQEELIQEQKELLELEKKRFTWLLENLLSGKYTVEESDDESLGKISLTYNSENVN